MLKTKFVLSAKNFYWPELIRKRQGKWQGNWKPLQIFLMLLKLEIKIYSETFRCL